MTYRIGQQVPASRERGIVHGPRIRPVWHALMVAPRKEKIACEILKRYDVYAFYPQRTHKHWRHGRRIVRRFPIVSGIVYARFPRPPQWDVMRRTQTITGVFCSGGRPVDLPREVIRNIQGLPMEAERLMEARRELLKVGAGDRARLVSGPFEGFFVDITRVEAGRVWFRMLTDLGRGEGKTAAENVKKVLPETPTSAI
ncbi:MAG: transcription termination/antitermination NusG family protein [Pseudomonadota bacterium]